MFEKSVVKGAGANPVFAALTQSTGKAPGWNFHKYLVNRRGQAVASFNSDISPTNPALVAALEKALGAR